MEIPGQVMALIAQLRSDWTTRTSRQNGKTRRGQNPRPLRQSAHTCTNLTARRTAKEIPMTIPVRTCARRTITHDGAGDADTLLLFRLPRTEL